MSAVASPPYRFALREPLAGAACAVHVMRHSFLGLGGALTHRDGNTETLRNDLLSTRQVADKLLGMQPTVASVPETVAASVPERVPEMSFGGVAGHRADSHAARDRTPS